MDDNSDTVSNAGTRAPKAVDAIGERDDSTYSVRAVVRVCRILDLLRESAEGATLRDIVEVSGLPKTSAFRYLRTLEHHRYVQRDPQSGVFRLGMSLMGMSDQPMESLAELCREHLIRLRDETGETVNLGVIDGTRVTYILVVESQHSVRLSVREGDRDYVHATGLGKAIAAGLPEDEVRRILQIEGMPKQTENTIADVDDFFYELRRVRRSGIAVDDGENSMDGRCIAVALKGLPIKAAISVSAPTSRFPPQAVDAAGRKLRETARRIESAYNGTGSNG